MSNELISKVKTWLEKQGYPLELQVARSLIDKKFFVEQALYYKDPDSSKAREIDVIGRFHSLPDISNIELCLELYIECKSSKSNPWIVISGEYSWAHSVTDIGKTEWTSNLLSNLNKIEQLPKCGFYQGSQTTGQALTVALRDSNNDTAWNALESISKAYSVHPNLYDSTTNQSAIVIRMPVIVVEGELLNIFLNEQNEIEILSINWARVIHKRGLDNEVVKVDVVASSFFDSYLATVKEETMIILSECEANLDLLNKSGWDDLF